MPSLTTQLHEKTADMLAGPLGARGRQVTESEFYTFIGQFDAISHVESRKVYTHIFPEGVACHTSIFTDRRNSIEIGRIVDCYGNEESSNHDQALGYQVYFLA